VNWFGLDWESILINTCALALIPLLLAVIGGYLAAEGIADPKRSRWIKLLFWALFVFGVVVTFWQQFRAAQSDQARDTRETWEETLALKQFPPLPVPTIERVMPSPPKPRLQFSFLPLGPHERLIDSISKPIIGGVVTVAFTAKNVSAAQANNGQIWIQICNGCKFAEEPEGSTPQPSEPVIRRKRFDKLYAGVSFDSTTLKIVPPVGIPWFTIIFKYACEQCPPIDNEHGQKLKINLIQP
jgi:hypothetical protein